MPMESSTKPLVPDADRMEHPMVKPCNAMPVAVGDATATQTGQMQGMSGAMAADKVVDAGQGNPLQLATISISNYEPKVNPLQSSNLKFHLFDMYFLRF